MGRPQSADKKFVRARRPSQIGTPGVLDQAEVLREPLYVEIALNPTENWSRQKRSRKECSSKRPHLCREEKSVHDHHRKKIFWRTFLTPKINFPGRWWIQKPYKNPGKPYPPPKSFLCGPHFFLQRKVLHWSRVVYGFFFPEYGLR